MPKYVLRFGDTAVNKTKFLTSKRLHFRWEGKIGNDKYVRW